MSLLHRGISGVNGWKLERKGSLTLLERVLSLLAVENGSDINPCM